MVSIVDYGVGNLFSLRSSLEAIGEDAVVTGDAEVIHSSDRVILPGVGAFKDAADKLAASGMDIVLKREAAQGKPVMGICLGMQLLFDKDYEFGVHQGLGLIPGDVVPIADSIPAGLKVPHMGWNSLTFPKGPHSLFKYIREGDYVYFVHSYRAVHCEADTVAITDYGAPLTAAVARNNVMGCQFHPEKSGRVGLNILRAFCEL